MKLKFLFLLIPLLLLVDALQAQPVRIHSNTDSLRAGQLFDVYVVFDNPGGFDKILLPDSTSFSDPFEFKERVRGLTRAGSDSVRIRLQFFGTKDTLIAGLSARGISGADTIRFDIADYPIYFATTLSEEDDIRPFKPIFDFSGSIWLWVLLIFLLIFAILLILWYRNKKRNKMPVAEPKEVVPIPPFVHPHKALADGITVLERELQAGSIAYDLFYVSAGDLIRAYFETTHRFPALEQTTKEVIFSIHKVTTNNRLINQTREMLQEADMVKFAKFTPDFDMMAEMIVKLRFFADQVRRDDDMVYRNLQAEYNRKYFKTNIDRVEESK